MTVLIRDHTELDVYQMAFSAAMTIFEITKKFPREETYALSDQIRRSSRSVCANIAEAWRRRRYKPDFINRLNIAEAEAAETQTWLQFALACGYITHQQQTDLHQEYNHIIGKLVSLYRNAKTWVIHTP